LWSSLTYCLPFFGIRRSFWITNTTNITYRRHRYASAVERSVTERRLADPDLCSHQSCFYISPVSACCCSSLCVRLACRNATSPKEHVTHPRWLIHKILLFAVRSYFNFRFRWPRGLMRRCAPARLLRLRVRIPSEAWIFVSFSCCVLYR